MSASVNPLIRLLRSNLSIPQLAGYAVSIVVGMSVIFVAFELRMDVRPLFSQGGLLDERCLVINKKVSLASAFNSRLTTFSTDEIATIAAQPFVRNVAWFTPSRFEVKAFTEGGGTMPYFSTDLFFESVPDRLMDVNPPQWQWIEADRTIPIIIPRSYLQLYNFGFAGSQQLPQLSENVIQQVSFQVLLSGQGRRERFTGRIVGFTNRLNTLLVPDAFMQWANGRFGEGSPKISRLIAELNNPADPAIAAFFTEHPNYETDSNGDDGRLSYLLNSLILLLIAIGLFILLPAIGLIFVSLHLLIYKNRETLGTLILLGYERGRLARPYNLLMLLINLCTGFVAYEIACYVRHLYLPKLSAFGILDISIIWLWIFAVCFVLLVSTIDAWWIRRQIGKIQRPCK